MFHQVKQQLQRKNLQQSAVALMAMVLSQMAMAGTVNNSDPFYQFLQAVQSYAKGAMGIGLCIVALLFGAIVGIGQNSPTAALTGVGFAIFVYFGPGIISSIFSAGAVLA